MKLGANDIGSVYLGTNAVQKVYLGANEVWSAAPPNPLLDDYPNAAAAYSLRKLRSAYTGSAIRVRRSNDNAEQDIGFVNNELDTSSLTSFCGVNNGFVKTWYDQSGNGNDASQTTVANQPQIVSSGGLIMDNGKVAINWDAIDDLLVNSSLNINQPISFFACANKTIGNGKHLFDTNTSKRAVFLISAISGVNQLFAGTASINGTQTILGQSLISGLFNASNSYMYDNGILSVSGNPGSNGMQGLIIGNSQFSGTEWSNKIQELIFYPSDQSLNRTRIEDNINSFYSIY